MENMRDLDQKNLVNVITTGRDFARQLQILLNSPSSSKEALEALAQKISISSETALSILCSSNPSMRDANVITAATAATTTTITTGVAIGGMSESPLSGSPRSEDSDQGPKDSSRKRKSSLRWTQQVRVNPGMGLEGPLDDGFCWRKYGQKDILGAKYPRGYYRCTHRIGQGCLATKQVQRSDEDPTIFEITYRGRHGCTQASQMLPPPIQPSPETQELNTSMELQNQENQQQSQDLLFNLRSGLKVITEGLDSKEQPPFPPFHFASTSNNVRPDTQLGFSPTVVDTSSNMGSYSPSFISPSSTSGNYFSSGMHQNLQTCDQSEFSHDIIPGATSSTNSPTAGLDFPFGNVGFDPNFTFDNHGFLP